MPLYVRHRAAARPRSTQIARAKVCAPRGADQGTSDWRACQGSLLMQHRDENRGRSCEFTAHTGGGQAAWMLFPSCCLVDGKAYILGCDACKTRKLSTDRCLRCEACGARYRPAALAWRRIEPIQ